MTDLMIRTDTRPAVIDAEFVVTGSREQETRSADLSVGAKVILRACSVAFLLLAAYMAWVAATGNRL